jgi:isopenicillin-N N-acyltransferase-like protein
MLASPEGAQMWEVSPDCREMVSEHVGGTPGSLYHTNHCLGREVAKLEVPSRLASTTHKRLELLEAKVPAIAGYDDLIDVLRDHENYPQSICSHAESHPQDPSHTCGGGVGDLRTGKVSLWRGCKEHDHSFQSREFSLTSAEVTA